MMMMNQANFLAQKNSMLAGNHCSNWCPTALTKHSCTVFHILLKDHAFPSKMKKLMPSYALGCNFWYICVAICTAVSEHTHIDITITVTCMSVTGIHWQSVRSICSSIYVYVYELSRALIVPQAKSTSRVQRAAGPGTRRETRQSNSR